MRKLLVPIDNSENALRALQYAIDLARDFPGIELHIVTAHEAAVENPRTLAYLPLKKLEEIQREHSASILAPAVERATAAGATFTSEILVGSVPKVIVERAEALGCHGIVMGTRGMGAVGSLVMGSVATKIVHLSGLPVTLVK